MDYRTPVFGFDGENLEQFAEPHTIGRTARLRGDRLVMESEIDRRILRRDELPHEGPVLDSGYPLLDWAFRIARKDLESNFYDGGIYAGANFRHTPTWVRDTAYTSMMGLSLFYPAKIAAVFEGFLDPKLGEIQFEQYRGYFEDRFYSMTDHILWVLAAEKLGRVQGDRGLLERGAPFAARTVSRMIAERLDRRTFLFAGGSSLFDGPSGYPDGFTGPLLRSSSTNLLYLRALKILSDLEALRGAARSAFEELRGKLGEALDRELWLDDRGYYAQLQYGANYREERFETLGNIVALGNPDLPAAQAVRILEALRQHPYGIPALTPWYGERIVYHSEGIWPFMMGLALWALRERRDRLPAPVVAASGADLTYVTAQLLRTSMLEGTFMELLHGRTGQGRYSPAQVWSAAAMLSVVENGIFGMSFAHDRVTFRPALPAFLRGRTVTLHDVPLRGRKATLSLSPELQVSIDGHPLPGNVLVFKEPATAAARGAGRPIELGAGLSFAAERDPAPAGPTVTGSGGGGTLRLWPAEIVVFPGEEQIGSYELRLRAENGSAAPRHVDLRIGSPGAGLTVMPDRLRLTVPAHGTVEHGLRLGFSSPPVDFGGGELTVTYEAGGLRVAIPVRRFLTLDCSWRFKPMFKMKSLGYGREFRHFDSWDLLRVPMRAEFRLGPYEGVLWYAKKLVIPADWVDGLVFYCGAMSDWDVTYFNGTVIGRTGSPEHGAHGVERRYAIPAEIVKPGEVNTIAVQVFGHGRENGLWRGPVFISRPDEVEWARETGQRVLDSNYLPPVEKGANAAN